MLPHTVHGGRRPSIRLDLLSRRCSDNVCPTRSTFYLRVHVLGVIHYGLHQHHRTSLNLRAPGHDLMKMPLFVWTWVITAYPADCRDAGSGRRSDHDVDGYHFGTSFFSAAGGGDPVLFQHVFWFFRSPRGVHHHPAGIRCCVADHSDLSRKPSVWL